MTNPNVAFQVFNMTLPPEGPVSIPQYLDFSAVTAIDVDLSQLIDDGTVSFISGIYFDNSANAHDVTIKCRGTNQEIIIPASAQGWYPVEVVNPPLFTFTQSAVGALLKILFFNFPIVAPYIIGSGSGSIPNPLDVNIVSPNPLPVNTASPTISDYTAVLTGASDAVIAAGDALAYLAIYNPVGNNPITVNLAGGDALTSGVVLNAGGNITVDQGLANNVTIAGTNGETVNVFGGV